MKVIGEPWVTGEGHQGVGSQVKIMRGAGVTSEGHEGNWGHMCRS